MPIAKLLVEGDLDAVLLNAVLRGRPLVEAIRGSKNALRPRTSEERHRAQQLPSGSRHREVERSTVFYLRDRDFDFEPPSTDGIPTPDEHGGEVLGWRWSRHSIESYLLEPQIVRAITDGQDYEAALLAAADRLRFYQAARWAVAQARTKLRPPYRLTTEPDDAREFRLPDDLSAPATEVWAVQQIGMFRESVAQALGEAALRESIRAYVARLAGTCTDVAGVLQWCSGKNLFAGLRDWAARAGLGSPHFLVNQLRDWVVENPDDALNALKEWQGFVKRLRQ